MPDPVENIWGKKRDCPQSLLRSVTLVTVIDALLNAAAGNATVNNKVVVISENNSPKTRIDFMMTSEKIFPMTSL
jgi:hypothetical protein